MIALPNLRQPPEGLSRPESPSEAESAPVPHAPEEVPGIVIRESHLGSGASSPTPRIPVFVYGEVLPEAPTLPFGRWKVAPAG